jgi:hypothetical protein
LNLQDENILSDSQNPLKIIYFVAIIASMSAFYKVYTGGGILANYQGILTAYSQHITTLLTALAFILFYWKRSIFAWWIALMYGPTLWLIYFIFQPFKFSQFISTLPFYAIGVWYLIVRYKPYSDYINQMRASE